MDTIAERLARCEREIAMASAEGRRLHSDAEHAIILQWEMDQRMERKQILAEMMMQAAL